LNGIQNTSYDPYVVEETVAEVREHWKGPYHFGAPDGIVVNVTKDKIWVREGVLPDFPNSKAPQFDFGNGRLMVTWLFRLTCCPKTSKTA
jgi:hypothetical protein